MLELMKSSGHAALRRCQSLRPLSLVSSSLCLHSSLQCAAKNARQKEMQGFLFHGPCRRMIWGIPSGVSP